MQKNFYAVIKIRLVSVTPLGTTGLPPLKGLAYWLN